MKKDIRNRIEELAGRKDFRPNQMIRSVSQAINLNTFRSSKNQKTLKGSREREPAIE